MKKKTCLLTEIFLIYSFYLCWEQRFSLPIYWNINFRRIRNLNTQIEKLEERIEKIFEEVVKEGGYKELRLPLRVKRVWGKLLSYQIPGKDENFVKKKIEDLILGDEELLKKTRKLDFEGLSKEGKTKIENGYNALRDFLSGYGMKLPPFSEFLKTIYVQALNENSEAYLWLSLLAHQRMVLTYGGLAEAGIAHEALHLFTGGFPLHILDEGTVQILLKDRILKGRDDFFEYRLPDKKFQEKIVRSLIQIVDPEDLIQGFLSGSYEPFKKTLSSEFIEILELAGIIQWSDKSSSNRYSWYDVIGQEDILEYVLESRDDKDKLRRIKEQLMTYLAKIN